MIISDKFTRITCRRGPGMGWNVLSVFIDSTKGMIGALLLAVGALLPPPAFATASVSAASKLDVPDTMAERMKPCTICHGEEDRTRPDAYYPRIAGKPEGYLYNQLRNFRDGRRYYRPMAVLLENLSDEYLMEMARYFSALKQPYPPPDRMVSTP